jgi:hypothetical protein
MESISFMVAILSVNPKGTVYEYNAWPSGVFPEGYLAPGQLQVMVRAGTI